MHIFYSPGISADHLFLDEEESWHAVKVLRLEENENIQIVNGKGVFYTAKIKKAHPKKCEVEILGQKHEAEKSYFIHIAIAPTKSMDRIEWFIEKSVEIGIDKITFLQTEHSERKNINLERAQKIAVTAIKQSLKATLPEISEITKIQQFLKECTEEQKFIAHLEEGKRKDLTAAIQKRKKYCILIGPEGDFSPEEIKTAKENGFIAVNLGTSRLRTETAGIVACHTTNLMNTI
ncbi:MAG: 16S rRNA (uracil(1498)-N(3))-methyltransferase [Cytophagaceae bacterium]|nr:16S rRNA (uracil(1498)-N(3))-methyltransferase [Cytophagaceae bacterium]